MSEPNHHMLLMLLKTIDRVDPFKILNQGKPDELTFGDRSFIAVVLRMIAENKDPRELFFEKRPTGRPQVKQMRLAIAVDVAINQALGHRYEDAKRLAMEKSGATEDQVKAALRYHHKAAKAFIQKLSPDRLKSEQQTNDERIAILWGKNTN